jgi:hypothetical protein
LAGRPIDLDRFVDVAAMPFRSSPVVQTRLVVRVEVRRPDPLAEMMRNPRDSIAAVRRFCGKNAADL